LAAKVEDVLDELGFVGTHKVYCFYNEMFLEANQEKEEEEEEEEQEDEEEDQQDEQQEEEDQQDEQQEEEDQQDEQQEEEDQQDEQQENQRAAHDDNYYYVSKADANVPSKNGVCMVS
jgi:archaellum component FlaD/FlaE